MDDREIVAALAAGDPAGIAAAYDTYAGPVYGYCRWMLREPAEAAEAARDTFVIAAGGVPADPGFLRSWFFATARGECLRRPSLVNLLRRPCWKVQAGPPGPVRTNGRPNGPSCA